MSDNPSTKTAIEIISAGAGSGKTYTLTERMTALLKEGVRPAGILAATFTQKAAAELQERVRARLLEAGMAEAAEELGAAMIGTVHSVGARLLQRFAFEAGVSPLVEIIADTDGRRLFNESLAQVLSEKRIARMNLLADRLGLTKNKQESYDWRRVIQDLTEVTRANNFSAETLKLSKKRSWESFEKLLPPARKDDEIVWNNRLLSCLDQTVAALESQEVDTTVKTREAVETFRNFQNQLKYRGELYWYEWVKIAKTQVGAKSRELVEELHEIALSHDEHPRFREDVKGFIDLVFDIAADALGEYEGYKNKRGLIDYTDMESSVSRLLRNSFVQETLRGEIDLLLVDEFQDTSPIQLDIFLQLSRLAKHSVWVGDPKQSIYGFRGAEPALMQAVIEESGGVKEENILKKSWRSRPEIVHAVNAIFTRAFPDMPEALVVLDPAFEETHAGQSGEKSVVPPLVHWHFRSELDETKTPGAPWMDHCIADQISILLQQDLYIYPKNRKSLRRLKPGDIAVLCRNNEGCRRMAEALHGAGLRASISRTGLLETPEIKLVLACLKYLLAPSDALSVAEILLLSRAMRLEDIVQTRLDYIAEARHAGYFPPQWAESELLRILQEIRPRTADLSAAEILSVVLEEADLRRAAVALGESVQRLDNIEMLRRFALEYESACTRLHTGASLGGFLLWLNQTADAGLDWQGSGESEDAVRVMTYHRSKGLEFPVTVCHSLDQNLKEQIWGINLVSEREKPDLDDILAGRWIRYWVNPYADQSAKTRLDEAVKQTEAWKIASKTALEEETRLLYVGLTRARDALIFPTTPRPTKWLNRVFNAGDESIPTLDPHTEETPFYHRGTPLLAHTEILYKPKDFPESASGPANETFHQTRLGKHSAPRSALMIDHRYELSPAVSVQFGDPLPFAAWLVLKGAFDKNTGDAVNAVLAADRPHYSRAQRLEMARRQIHIRGSADTLSAEALANQSEAFHLFLAQRFPGAKIEGNYPLESVEGRRQLRLEADLYVETPERMGLFFFAPFAEGMKKWKQTAQSLAPSIYWASRILRRSIPEKTLDTYIIFPFEGQAAEVYFTSRPVEAG